MLTDSGLPSTTYTPINNSTYLWIIASVAALGGLLFGYDWVVIGGAKPFYEAYFRLGSESLVGWANSCALVGCLLGSVLSGGVSDQLGRKKLLVASGFLFGVSSLLTGAATAFSWFVFWRIVGGMAIGIASNVSPTYIAEISPAVWRGRLVSLNQLTIVIGILLAQIVNWSIAQPVASTARAAEIRASWNGQVGWRWMFFAIAVPSLVFLVSATFVPESPRWLLKKSRTRNALDVLTKIGGPEYGLLSVSEIKSSLEAEADARKVGGPSPQITRILWIGVALAVLQQWSGINVIFNYAVEIYRSAGYGLSDVLFNIVITGAVNVVATLVSFGFVDRLGRRSLMLAGCAGIGLSHLLIGAAYRAHLGGWPLLVFTLAAIGCYGASLAPVTWVLISELFPNRIRGFGVSVAVSALWIASFLLTFTFPLILRTLGADGTFWLYAAVCLGGFFFVWRNVPETKGKSLEQIEQQLMMGVRDQRKGPT